MQLVKLSTPDAYSHIVKQLKKRAPVQSRSGETRENTGVIVRSNNPRRRWLMRPNINWAFGLQESFAYWNGLNPGHVHRYNSNMEQFMYKKDDDEKKKLHGSAYGRYLRQIPHDQIDRVIKQLRANKQTRQAVINIHQSDVEDYDRGDVACTVYLNFLVRDGRLHMFATMRSQDMLYGYPYDTQAFQWLQEVLAGILDLKLGFYEHRMDSCHYYTRKQEHIDKTISEHEIYELPDMRLEESELATVMDHLDSGLSVARQGLLPYVEIEYIENRHEVYADWLRLMTAYEQYRFYDHDDADAHARKLANDIDTEAFREYMEYVL